MERLYVTRENAGSRLDHYVCGTLQQFSRSIIQRFVREGNIRLNGAPAKPGTIVRDGDCIEVEPPPPVPVETQPQEIPLAVLFEDDNLIVVNKPAGLVVHPAAGNPDGTLVNALLHHCRELSGIGGEQRPGIVHRLDKETSGCIVVAKNDSAHGALSRQFAGRSVTKIYLALVKGRPRIASGKIEAPIGRHPVHRKKMAVVERGRTAFTEYRSVQSIGNNTLVFCTLHTGRTHQIRVHMKHLGHPLCGDPVYGARESWPRTMLHAFQLGFDHPVTGERLMFTSPLPQDFLEAGAKINL